MFEYTHLIKDLSLDHLSQSITLCGFVSNIRDLGSLVFIDLRDDSGFLQITLSKDIYKTVTLESVIKVTGILQKKEESNTHKENNHLEIHASEYTILSLAQTLPFLPSKDANEDLKGKYRYLDLRSKQDILQFRSDINFSIRTFFHQEGFTEIETPILSKSTPEGARDYLVPSRIYPGSFYALPQSPQTFKQLLILSGTSKYFQICKCFRDEDLRSDRQPEFTQVDFEIAYPKLEFFKDFSQRLFSYLLNDKISIEELSFQDAEKFYGSDKPDLRFDLRLEDPLETTFPEISSSFRMLYIDKLLPRSTIEKFCQKNIFWFKKDTTVSGGISKFLKEEPKKDGIYFFGLPKQLGELRLQLGKEFYTPKEGLFFLWIKDFPLFEESSSGLTSTHHPFTRVQRSQLQDFLEGKNLLNLKADAYDLVCNGFELGGGSLRIHNPEEQLRMFELLGLSSSSIEKQFGFFLEALQYGVPPHGGMALGLDRIIMILKDLSSIKDVIAFPKTNKAYDLMNQSPSEVSFEQLKDLHLSIDRK